MEQIALGHSSNQVGDNKTFNKANVFPVFEISKKQSMF